MRVLSQPELSCCILSLHISPRTASAMVVLHLSLAIRCSWQVGFVSVELFTSRTAPRKYKKKSLNNPCGSWTASRHESASVGPPPFVSAPASAQDLSHGSYQGPRRCCKATCLFFSSLTPIPVTSGGRHDVTLRILSEPADMCLLSLNSSEVIRI